MRKPADPFPTAASIAAIDVENISKSRNHGHSHSNKKLKKGLWSPEEDEKLMHYMLTNGQGCWTDVAKKAGLQRCGKSCRLRWINYLRPDLKRGAFSPQEEDLIIRLHSLLGNRWSQIAARLPGRTDNEIKNFWNSTIKKRLKNMLTNTVNSSISPSSSPDSSSSSLSSSSSSLELKDIIGSFMSLQEQGFITTTSSSSSKALNHMMMTTNKINPVLPVLVDHHHSSNQLCNNSVDPRGDGFYGVNARVEGEFYLPPMENVGCDEGSEDWYKADFTSDGFANHNNVKVDEITNGAGDLWNGTEGFKMEEWDLVDLMTIEAPSFFFNL